MMLERDRKRSSKLDVRKNIGKSYHFKACVVAFYQWLACQVTAMACVINQVAKAFEVIQRSLFCRFLHLCRWIKLNMMNRIVIDWSCWYSLIPRNAQSPYQQLKGAGISQAFRQSSQGCSMRSPTTQYCTRQGSWLARPPWIFDFCGEFPAVIHAKVKRQRDKRLSLNCFLGILDMLIILPWVNGRIGDCG